MPESTITSPEDSEASLFLTSRRRLRPLQNPLQSVNLQSPLQSQLRSVSTQSPLMNRSHCCCHTSLLQSPFQSTSSLQYTSLLQSPLKSTSPLHSSFQSRSPLLSPLQSLPRVAVSAAEPPEAAASASAPLWVVTPTPELCLPCYG